MASKVILITGANRGIGLGIVKSITRRSDEHTIIIASRNKTDATKAIVELQESGLKAPFHALALDITDDNSIEAAVKTIDEQFGRIDGKSFLYSPSLLTLLLIPILVLVNNAGTAQPLDPASSLSALRSSWTQTLSTNLTSTHILTSALLPLLHLSPYPRVINISSARGSFARILSGRDPPVANLPYSCSKSCLNFLTVQMARAHEDVAFYAVSPGHCSTRFNGFRGRKDPMEGGRAAAELALAKEGLYPSGSFWEDEGEGMVEVGW